MNESLRIEPPVRSGTAMQVKETLKVGGYTIKSDIPFLINFYFLQRNPKEW